MKRQIRFYARSFDNPERHKYNVLIINERRGINAIKQKLFEEMMPVDELEVLTSGWLGNGISYELFSFCSPKVLNQIDWNGVYQGFVKLDGNLTDRRKSDGLANYVDNHVSKLACS